ncbi:hypothetical protein RyT2_11650 [Pseudolactococcus yaeyamensis]
MGKTKSKIKKKKRRMLVRAIENDTVNPHKVGVSDRCPECNVLKVKCRAIWIEQRKCCPDCRC